MPSTCYNQWVVYENSKGHKKWVNEGPAPDGECPSCPEPQYPAAGVWNGYSAMCQDGHIVKMVANGTGGLIQGDVIQANSGACYISLYIGTGPISNYFP